MEVGYDGSEWQEENWEAEEEWTTVALGAMKGKGKPSGGKSKSKGNTGGGKGFQGSCWTCGQFVHSQRECPKGGKGNSGKGKGGKGRNLIGIDNHCEEFNSNFIKYLCEGFNSSFIEFLTILS